MSLIKRFWDWITGKKPKPVDTPPLRLPATPAERRNAIPAIPPGWKARKVTKTGDGTFKIEEMQAGDSPYVPSLAFFQALESSAPASMPDPAPGTEGSIVDSFGGYDPSPSSFDGSCGGGFDAGCSGSSDLGSSE